MATNNSDIAKVRNFWDSRPCNIRHSLKKVGTLEYFEEARTRRYIVEHHIKPFGEFEKWRGKSVLEIGCGIGADAVEFAINGAAVTAVELSPKSLAIAKKRFQVYGLQGAFYESNTEELSKELPVKSYDLIYSFGVIHHTPNPERALKELKKYCQDGTELRIMLYSKWSWKLAWIIMHFGHGRFWKWRELVARYSEAQTGSPFTYVYSAREIRKLFSKNFKIVSITKDFIFPYRVPDYIEYRYIKVWYFRFLPQPVFRGLERLLGWHMLVVAKSI